jgi:hypothetical protein
MEQVNKELIVFSKHIIFNSIDLLRVWVMFEISLSLLAGLVISFVVPVSVTPNEHVQERFVVNVIKMV